ncbi:MAG: hypothetical protein IJI85_09275 [Clostridia bacterium]|nr:hypothetical protein [Clostridia bacterium]MBQ9323676.1 hypothetical protein [Clostridia bacterium]MBR0422749.1 hypothetical protein [Clostridia bacterium]
MNEYSPKLFFFRRFCFSLKRKSGKTVLVILSALLLVACQPTPEVDAVRQKNSAKMIEMAKGETAAAPQAAEEGPAATPTPVRDLMPERLQWDFYTDVKNIHVTADVPIRIRTEDTFPLLRVKPWTGSPTENLKIVQALLGTDTVYKSVYQVTRADLEKQIRDLMNTLSDPYNNKELLEDFGREELEELVPRWQARLEELQEQYRNFKDGEPQPNPLWDGQPEDDMHQTVLVTGAWDKDNAENYDSVYFFARSTYPEHWSMDMMRKGDWGAAYDYGMQELIDPADYDMPHWGSKLTPRQAANKVQSILAPFVNTAVVDILWSNNASDTYGSDGTKLRWGYVVRLMPLYHGTATGVGLGRLPMLSRDPVTNVGRSWEQEYIMGAVTDEGVRRLTWGCPLKVTEVVAEHAQLLPFSEIEQIAQQQINRRFAYHGEENGSLAVAGVILGLVYMGEQNNAEGGLLAPVWVFLKADRPNEQQQELWAQLGQTPATPYYDTLNPLAMINAVDGTIIDPYAGY